MRGQSFLLSILYLPLKSEDQCLLNSEVWSSFSEVMLSVRSFFSISYKFVLVRFDCIVHRKIEISPNNLVPKDAWRSLE